MDTIRRADYFSLEITNKPGEGARLLAALRDAGINLTAFTGFPSGRRAQIDFIPEDSAAFKAAARKLGIKAGTRKTVFLVQGDDRPGAIAEICEKLAGAGINMIAMDAASAGNGRYAGMFWVAPGDVRKATKVLGAS
ncbi:MAG: ACT domain-containing protein [Burkholderiales bacterium]